MESEMLKIKGLFSFWSDWQSAYGLSKEPGPGPPVPTHLP